MLQPEFYPRWRWSTLRSVWIHTLSTSPTGYKLLLIDGSGRCVSFVPEAGAKKGGTEGERADRRGYRTVSAPP